MEANNWIRTYVIQILPALAFFVYIIGFAYYIVYYYQFGINIISYITLTEVLVSTLIPLLIVFGISMPYFVFKLSFRSTVKRYKIIFNDISTTIKKHIPCGKISEYYASDKRKFKLINKHFEHKERLNSYYSSVIVLSVMFSLTCVIIPLYIYMDIIKMGNKYFTIFILLLLIYPAINSYYRAYKKIRFDVVKNYHIISSLILVFIAILFCSIKLGIYHAQQDKQDSKRLFNISTINNLEYTDRDYNYIGECASAIFLYQNKNNNTIILNKTNIISSIYDTSLPSVFYEIKEELERNSK